MVSFIVSPYLNSDVEEPSDQVSSVSQQGLKGGRIEEKKTIRQRYNMTPASAEAEVGLSFSSLLLYHFKYKPIIRSVLGQGIQKLIKSRNHSFMGLIRATKIKGMPHIPWLRLPGALF